MIAARSFLAPCCSLALLAACLLGGNLPARADSPFLPDTAVLLRVGPRVVRSADYVQAYFAQLAKYQPPADSAGRVAFLEQLTAREILSSVALQANKPLEFADRAELRRHSTDVLSNVLFRRMIEDSVQVSDAEVEALRRSYHVQKRMQHILFADRATAERVRVDLAGKRIPWAQAQARYSKAQNDSGPQGDVGWRNRADLLSQGLAWVFDLEPGQISTVFRAAEGYQVARVVASRPTVPIAFLVRPDRLRSEIRRQKEAALAERLQARLAEQIGLTYDDANIAWAAKFFEPGAPFSTDSLGRSVIKALKVPFFAPEDTGRVVARWRGGSLSLQAVRAAYEEVHPLLRTSLHTPEDFRTQARSVVLKPYRAQLAIQLGLEKDSITVAEMEKKRLELLVNHLYQDSIEARISVTDRQLHDYYDKHIGQFMSYSVVHYAAIKTGNKRSADSLATLIRKGMPPQDIMRADSIRVGARVGRFLTMTESVDAGRDFYKLLLEDLKPGEVAVEPDEKAGYWVLKSLTFDPGHQLSFDEVRNLVEESVQNLAAEDLLKRFLDRHRRSLRVEAHPELVMRVDLRDPSPPQ